MASNKLIKDISNNLSLYAIMVLAFILKFISLGYSNYQGDEIKALFLPDTNTVQGGWQFLLEQRKGPLQFIVTLLTKQINPTYSSEFITRIPFAIAAFLSVYFFYRFVQYLFGKRVAFYASFFFVTNGFFAAFSRIVQYQSFVILFSVLTLFLLESFAQSDFKKFKLIYGAAICWAISILFHYDGFFIAPVVLKYLIDFWRSTTKKNAIIHTIFVGTVFLVSLSWFFVPYIYSVSQSTIGYWQGRLSGEVSDKISSSLYLFKVYQPIYVIYIYGLLTLIGTIAFVYKKYYRSYYAIALWLLITVFLWEQIVYIPGTHIYTYLMPLFIIMGIGIKFTEELWTVFLTKVKLLKFASASSIIISIVFAFIFLQSYAIYVDHSQEYPWQPEKFLVWTFPQPVATFHLSMFGFPYFREWEGISQFVAKHPDVTAYSTNERDSMSRYYIKLRKDANLAGFYIFVRYPQTFADNILSEKALYWANKYPPVYTFSRGGNDLVSIYLMPTGGKDEIILAGY